MKNKLIQLYKDTRHYKSSHPFIYTFILGVISTILLTLYLFLISYTLVFIRSFFPGMSLGKLLLILTFGILGFLVIGGLTSAILDEWS